MEDLAALARAAVVSSLDVKKGERVWVHGWDHTIDLLLHLASESKKLGAEVLVTVQPEDLWLQSILTAPLESLETLSQYHKALLERTDVFIFTLGPRRPISWAKVPQERRREASIWLDTRYDRSKLAEQWVGIASKRGIRMLAMESTLATPERAESAGLDYEKWRVAMYLACMEDPNSIPARATRLVPLLAGEGKVNITTPDGTELGFELDRRSVTRSDGLATKEKAEEGLVTYLPAGGVEVTVAEETAYGRLVYDLPISTPDGVVEELTIQVGAGRIKKFTGSGAIRGIERYLAREPNAGRLSFFGFGLNSKMRFGFTQDDKVLGGVVIGFGDNERKGGKNGANGQEWWGAISKATVKIGSETVMRNGVLAS